MPYTDSSGYTHRADQYGGHGGNWLSYERRCTDPNCTICNNRHYNIDMTAEPSIFADVEHTSYAWYNAIPSTGGRFIPQEYSGGQTSNKSCFICEKEKKDMKLSINLKGRGRIVCRPCHYLYKTFIREYKHDKKIFNRIVSILRGYM